MIRLVARRILSGGLLLVGLSIATFWLADLAPGDPLSILKLDNRIPEETIAAMTERYRLEGSLPERYGAWLHSVAIGDFGFSVAYQRPVGELLGARAWRTMLLVLTAFAFCWTSAVLLAMGSALHPQGWLDRLARWWTAALLAVPRLLLALAGLWLASWLEFLPLGGMRSLDADELGFWARQWDVARHLVLPAVVLAASFWPSLYLHARDAIGESLEQPYIRAARAHGLGRQRFLWTYVLPAASNPLISLCGLSITTLLSGSLLVEVVLGWPGMGALLLEGILAHDLHVVLASVLTSGFLLIVGHLLSDALLALTDPRLRLGREP